MAENKVKAKALRSWRNRQEEGDVTIGQEVEVSEKRYKELYGAGLVGDKIEGGKKSEKEDKRSEKEDKKASSRQTKEEKSSSSKKDSDK